MGTGCEGTQAAGSPALPSRFPLPSRLGKLTTLLFGLVRAPRSRPFRHTSSVPGCSGPVPQKELVHPAGHLGCKGWPG